ncbi:MAG: hypothetical protein DRH15_02950 [Deltaproteobacteria bacterium]|nr:Coenzyme F420 hydrogenase/dehydrogenase, beta subunit C-terminal domain [Deltaproteobacteria bacterium]MBW2081725.1 Coenzyme F420 hydrogenase/dehydrogenase, beta subunit C-terminal domain [Deltaproteobacteria bacterium]RLB85768.1 MAG: hypothetical protein DRH15_02950 [Deltaproteobacteria bacterium]
MEQTTVQGQSNLVREVLEKGICVRCGACVGICPYFQYHDGKVVVSDWCQASTWRCVQVCPRLPYDRASLYDYFYHVNDCTDAIGPHRQVVAARSGDKLVRSAAQYGGVVTALVIFAMEEGLVNSAVLTDRGGDLAPKGVLCSDREAVLGCAGSRYSASAALSELNLAIQAGNDRLAFIGLPCQMEALGRLSLSEPDGQERAGHVELKIGLFCTWALDYRALRSYLKTKGIVEIPKKYDIPPPPSEVFIVETNNGRMEFPLSEVREIVQPGCSLCEDMTAEFADISVGTLEGDKQWNTVIVRTDKGMELFEKALRAGVLEQKEIPSSNLEHLKEAASNKRKRALRARGEESNE